MPQSHSLLLAHIIFSTKDRRPFLHDGIRTETHAYLSQLVRDEGCECYRVGGVADHVHIAVRMTRTIHAAKLLENIKSKSSGWLKTKSADLKHFAWQRGYGIFSVSPPARPELLKYIDNQDAHHKLVSFQDEYRMFLQKYEIVYDERYVWD